jgi:hypothetical protein
MLSTKVSRLFTTFHSRGEDEQTNDSVAGAVSARLGRTISGDHLEAIRSGEFDNDGEGVGDDLLIALAEYFQVPPTYLTATGPDADAIDLQLRLLTAARDAGVRSLALRGGVDVSALTHALSVLGQRDPTAR